MERNEIGSLQQFVQRNELNAKIALQVVLAARRPVENVHLEAASSASDGRADASAASNQTQGLSEDASADQMVRLPAGEHAPAHKLVSFDDAAGDREHEAEADVCS